MFVGGGGEYAAKHSDRWLISHSYPSHPVFFQKIHYIVLYSSNSICSFDLILLKYNGNVMSKKLIKKFYHQNMKIIWTFFYIYNKVLLLLLVQKLSLQLNDVGLLRNMTDIKCNINAVIVVVVVV